VKARTAVVLALLFASAGAFASCSAGGPDDGDGEGYDSGIGSDGDAGASGDVQPTDGSAAEAAAPDCTVLSPVTAGDWQPWSGAADAAPDGPTSPSGRAYAGLAWGRVGSLPVAILFGGGSLSAGVLGDAWRFDPSRSSWSPSPGGPGARSGLSLYFAGDMLDASAPSNGFVLFGGENQDYIGDTWRFSAGTWSLVCGGPDAGACACGPCGRAHHSIAYDSRRAQAVLFGGRTDSGPLQETWLLDAGASTWSPACATSCEAGTACCTPPSPRSDHALAYDATRGITVLFGGTDANDNYLGDTWEWDGQVWTEAHPAHSPPARAGHAMSAAPGTSGVVLVGGVSGSGPVRDAPWTWDGTDWTPVTVSGATPVARAFGVMATDPVDQAALLFGGGSTGEYEDTWLLSLARTTPEGGCPAEASAPSACARLDSCCTELSNSLEQQDCMSAVTGSNEPTCQSALSLLEDGGICP
jgi:hypothetical protein